MPFVNIKITREGATTEQKEALIAGVTQLLVDTMGKNPATTSREQDQKLSVYRNMRHSTTDAPFLDPYHIKIEHCFIYIDAEFSNGETKITAFLRPQ